MTLRSRALAVLGLQPQAVAQDPVTVVGQSHVAALVDAAQMQGWPLRPVRLMLTDEAARSADGRQLIDREVISRLAPKAPVFSVMGGGYHLTIGLLNYPPVFDFWMPAAPFDERRTLLPQGAVRQLLDHNSRHQTEILRRIVERAPGEVFQFQAPPPPLDNARMAADISALPGQTAPTPPERIEPPAIRHKVWRLYSECTLDLCRELGVTYVPCPPEAFCEDGYLRPELYADPTHGNAAYGALVLDQIRSILKPRRRSAQPALPPLLRRTLGP